MWFAKTVALSAGLSANDLVLTPRDAPRRLRLSDCVHIQHETPHNADVDDAPWRPSVERLAQALTQWPSKDKRLQIHLSNRWVRWQLVPAQEHLASDEELESFVALHFLDVYGAASQNWRICHPVLVPGKSTPACAIDSALLDALQAACAASGTELESVQPYLSSAFDYWREKIREKVYWLAVVEPACVCLVYVANGAWRAVRTQRLLISHASQLAALTEKFAVAAGLAQSRVPLFLAGNSPVEFAATDTHASRLSLTGTVLHEHPQFCLAVGM